MTAKFYAILTNQGAALLANATALGTKLNITQMSVGDGNGTLPTPDATQTKLVNQKRIAPLNMLSVDANNSSQIIAEQVIPENEGGFWIREIGLYDDNGVLIAVANCPETYKPQLQEGSGRTQTIRMVLIVSSTAAVTLKIDPSVVLATRQYADDKAIEVKIYADNLLKQHIADTNPHKQYAPIVSPVFTGTPKAPTPAAGNNTTQLATTEFVQAVVTALVNGAPDTLDTLKKIAAAINNDPKFSETITSTITNGLKEKQPKDATLTALADLATGANKMPYFTGADIAAMTDITEVGRSILAKATVDALMSYLGAVKKAGDEMGGRLTLPQTSSFGVNVDNALGGSSIAIGDADSGIKNEADGVLGIYANNQKMLQISNIVTTVLGALKISNGTLQLDGATHYLRHAPFDTAGFEGNNIEVASWNGIGLPCTYDNITRIYFSTRNGEIGLRGDLKAAGNVYSGNAWLDQTGNLQGSTWGSGVGLKNYLDNTFNKKNTASLTGNYWQRDESTGVIMQWGYLPSSNNTFNFPRAFPNQCHAVFVTNADAQGTGVDNAFGYPVSNSQFFAATKSTTVQGYPVSWFALGR
ncbi:phage tail protein [Salmonella enterica]|uniref:phage tail-collar fiber domain-containing protein n=1 Tax=Citrobacter freundii TaxID=546 RepID=UPI00141401BE|nr:phage tail protein [Citrobacter freundii]EAZ5991693.1 hypothetical protein [Salmonella enterica]EBY2261613.1 hypothetical protein [Salmonella enterica subsp. enterica serovar Newport]EBJ0730120.1 hypothetical protein [Salmonella enterica]ECO6783099.1 hypothetical protein [Salmonella enterica]ECO7517315.1 hypothetical protein [Salmonella enterica]